MTAVLGDLRVLDLSWVVAGPLIGRALADFSATVVRVESSRRVETARLMQPFHDGVQGIENSALYGTCNAGKLGVSIDLGTGAGRDVVRDLARWADVLVESFSPGRMARWGLDYKSLSADHPGLIMLSTSIMGQTGPHAGLAGFGNIGASLSGFQHLVGWPDRLPLGPFGPYTDYVAPRVGLLMILAALEHRRKTGRGCYIDVSQVESGILFLSPQVTHYFADGTVAQRQGNRDDVFAPHGVYPTRADDGTDRFVAIAVRDDTDWASLTRTMEAPDLADDPELASATGRRAQADLLDRRIGQWTATLSAEEAEQRLQAAGVPAHVSASSRDFVGDPQLAQRGHIVTLPHALHGQTTVEGPRYLMSDTPGEVRRAAPTIGQDNEHVLLDILGYSRERYDQLEATGALR